MAYIQRTCFPTDYALRADPPEPRREQHEGEDQGQHDEDQG